MEEQYYNLTMRPTYATRLECASETGYPSCLIAKDPRGPVCKVAVNKEMNDRFNQCLSMKMNPALQEWLVEQPITLPVGPTPITTAGSDKNTLVKWLLVGAVLYFVINSRKK